MQPGRLADWLVFEKKNEDSSWTVDLSVWGEYRPLGASSFQTNMDGTELSRIGAQFITRYRADIHAATHRIHFDNKIWAILEPIPDRKRTMITIDATWTDPIEED